MDKKLEYTGELVAEALMRLQCALEAHKRCCEGFLVDPRECARSIRLLALIAARTMRHQPITLKEIYLDAGESEAAVRGRLRNLRLGGFVRLRPREGDRRVRVAEATPSALAYLYCYSVELRRAWSGELGPEDAAHPAAGKRDMPSWSKTDWIVSLDVV